MKNTKLLLFAALVCLMAVSCKKDEGVMDITLDKFVMGDTGFVSNDNSKVALQFSANKLIYEEGDYIKVNGESYSLSKSGSGASTVWYASGNSITASSFYCAYADGVESTISGFTGSSYHFNLAGRLNSATNKILLGGVTENNVLTLHPACAIIRLPLNASYSNVKVGFEGNKVLKEGTMEITSGAVTISGHNYMTGVDVSGTGADFLSMEYNTTEGYWYVAVPVSTTINTKLYFYWELGGEQIGMQTSGRVTLTKGYVYTLGSTRQTPFNADGTSKCKFKVSSARGEYVRFSPGNLQAKFVSNTTWQFASTQLERLGAPGAANIDRDGVWYDLFGFGTSDWNSGAAGYRSYYSVNDPADYIQNSLTGSYANADWGVRNGSSILYQGSPSGTTWRTLTNAEWGYLIGRSNKVAFATIEGVKGIILLPDINANDEDWTLPEGISLSFAKTSYTNNTISESNWNTLELAGVIFLPVTGYRQETTFYGSEEGHYWSSTYDGVNSDGWDNYAYGLKFTGSSVSATSTNMFTSQGRAVRLVHPEF